MMAELTVIDRSKGILAHHVEMDEADIKVDKLKAKYELCDTQFGINLMKIKDGEYVFTNYDNWELFY